MLTLKIKLTKSEKPYMDIVNDLDTDFPGLTSGNSVLQALGPEHGIHLTLKTQDKLTDEQRDWLHLSTFAARYIQSYTAYSDVEATTKENALLREELKMLVEDLREIVDIHGVHDMTSTPTEKLSRMADGIEGMFKKEASNA